MPHILINQKKSIMAFTVTMTLTFEVLEEIAKANSDLGLTIREGMKGAAAMGGGAAAGAMVGILAGPPGMLFGGIVGFGFGFIAAAQNMNSFKPLWEVLGQLNPANKQKLVEVGKKVLQEKGINLASHIVGMYGSQVARAFLGIVFEEFSGRKVNY